MERFHIDVDTVRQIYGVCRHLCRSYNYDYIMLLLKLISYISVPNSVQLCPFINYNDDNDKLNIQYESDFKVNL